MQALKSKITKALPLNAEIDVGNNSGAKTIKIFSVRGIGTAAGRIQEAGIADLVVAAVKKGRPDMRKQVVFAVIVRQKKKYKRPDGTRVGFEDNAAVVCKDEKGNPKGTLFKGPIAKEVCERWPAIAKVAGIIV